jgi:putative flippase GtrA
MTKSKKSELLKLVKYTCFAASAGVIQVTTNLLFNEVCHFPAWLSYFISLVLSVIWNFTFNRKFTFHAANSIPVAMAKVAGYYCVFTPLSILWTYELCDVLGMNRYAIEAVTILINFATEFLFQKFLVFNDKPSKESGNAPAKEQAEEQSKDLVEGEENQMND